MAEIARDAVEEAFETLPKPRRRDPDEVAEAIRRAVRSAIAERWKKKPICHVHVLERLTIARAQLEPNAQTIHIFA